jgi:CRP/FNR family transcriptional regulator/CRP/FNR family cyclic AMP-dependent transcriptional regulator
MGASEIFDDFHPLESGSFHSFCDLVKVADSEILVRQGDTSTCFFVVMKGTLKVVDQRSGEDFFLARLSEGDVFGEMSFIDGSPRSATVVSEGESEVLRMTRESFGLLQSVNPHLGMLVVIFLGRMMSGRLRVVDEKMAGMARERDNRELSELRRLISGIRSSVKTRGVDTGAADLL